MTAPEQDQHPSGLIPDVAVIYLLFFLSGISGLIYQTVWLRTLIRVLGCTVYATAVILAAFMAGLALGSFVLGRWSARVRNPLRLYAGLELGVGVAAVLLLFILPHLVPLYRLFYEWVGGNRLGLSLLESLTLFGLLLLPTFLMGGTLPVLSAHTRQYGTRFVSRLGNLYGLNTLGAVVGVLASGLVLIGAQGETCTVLVGAAINFGVAYLAYRVSCQPTPSLAAATGEAAARATISPYTDAVRRRVLIAYAISGFAAMGYEIVWTRLFQIHAGTSIYAFSLMLAFYLAGIAAGSLWGGAILPRLANPLCWFAVAQVGMAFYSILGIYLFLLFEPQLFEGSLRSASMVLVPLLLVTPITFVLGFVFPAVSRCYVRDETQSSQAVGSLYAMNTLGCILGSLVTGFVLIGTLGTRGSLVLLAGVNLALGGWMALQPAARTNGTRALKASGILAACTVALIILAPDPFRRAIQHKVTTQFAQVKEQKLQYFLHQESAAATTTAFRVNDEIWTKQLWINGMGMTQLCVETKLIAHLPLLLHPDPARTLVVCMGMGTTLRSALVHPGMRCDVVELVPEAYDCFPFFHADGAALLKDARVRYYVDDGRNHLLMHNDTYDVIAMDPAPPLWSAGTVNLYSREFFALCRQRLNPGGIVCVWIPPAPCSEIRMIMRTFVDVFPNTYLWGGPTFPGFFLTGLPDQAPLNLERFHQTDRNQAILADANEWQPGRFGSTEDFLRLRLANPRELMPFLGDGPIVTDDRPYTEFPLWRSFNDPLYRLQLDALVFMRLRKQVEASAPAP